MADVNESLVVCISWDLVYILLFCGLKEHKNKSNATICPVLNTDIYFEAMAIVLSHMAVFPQVDSRNPCASSWLHSLSLIFLLMPFLHLLQLSSVRVPPFAALLPAEQGCVPQNFTRLGTTSQKGRLVAIKQQMWKTCPRYRNQLLMKTNSNNKIIIFPLNKKKKKPNSYLKNPKDQLLISWGLKNAPKAFKVPPCLLHPQLT